MDVSMNDGSAVDPSESGDQTQTQPVSQPLEGSTEHAREQDLDAQSWGLLIPCVTGISPVRFFKNNLEATIGRDSKCTVHLPWVCISKNFSYGVALLQLTHDTHGF